MEKPPDPEYVKVTIIIELKDSTITTEIPVSEGVTYDSEYGEPEIDYVSLRYRQGALRALKLTAYPLPDEFGRTHFITNIPKEKDEHSD